MLTLIAATTAGILAGMLVGLLEISGLRLLGGPWDLQALFWALAAYGAAGGLAGAGLGLLGRVFRRWLRFDANGWMYLSGGAVLAAAGLIVVRFRILRDLFQERLALFSPTGLLVHAALFAVFGAIFVASWLAARRTAATEASGAAPSGDQVSRRSFLKVAAATGLAALPAAAVASQFGGRHAPSGSTVLRTGAPASLRQKPNVIFIVADTLRADHVGAYGYRKAKTPRLDALAADSLQFANAFSQASWTKPSMATMLTSLYPSTHKAVYKSSALPRSVVTLPEVLNAQGYLTGALVNNVHMAPIFNFQQGFGDYEFMAPDYLFGATETASQLAAYQVARRVSDRLSSGVSVHHFYQPAEVVNERAFGWLQTRMDERFFLFLHYMDPHDPYFDHPFNGSGIARVSTPNPDPDMAPEMVRLYDGEIAYMDRQIGALVDWLKAAGLYDETLIVFTADHGEEFYEHGGWWHGLTLFEEQLHVPLLVKLPGSEGAGTVDTAVARTLDLPPTILGAAGIDAPVSMQGMNLLGAGSRAELSFAETDHEGNVVQSIRGPAWKLIDANPGNPRGLPDLSLYHLAEDPGETFDLSGSEPEKTAELSRQMSSVMTLAEAQAVASAQGSLDETALEQLRNLGY